MNMAIDSDRATKAGQKSNSKDTMSVSIDKVLKAEFIHFCQSRELKYAPIVEDLIAQFMEDQQPKKKKN